MAVDNYKYDGRAPYRSGGSRRRGRPSVTRTDGSGGYSGAPDYYNRRRRRGSSSPYYGASGDYRSATRSYYNSSPGRGLDARSILGSSRCVDRCLIPGVSYSTRRRVIHVTLSSVSNIRGLVFSLPGQSLGILRGRGSRGVAAGLRTLNFNTGLIGARACVDGRRTGRADACAVPGVSYSTRRRVIHVTLTSVRTIGNLAFSLPGQGLGIFRGRKVRRVATGLRKLNFKTGLSRARLSANSVPGRPSPIERTGMLGLLLNVGTLLFFVRFVDKVVTTSAKLVTSSLSVFTSTTICNVTLCTIKGTTGCRIGTTRFTN